MLYFTDYQAITFPCFCQVSRLHQNTPIQQMKSVIELSSSTHDVVHCLFHIALCSVLLWLILKKLQHKCLVSVVTRSSAVAVIADCTVYDIATDLARKAVVTM